MVGVTVFLLNWGGFSYFLDMKINRIDHLVIPVRDIRRSLQFYTEVLGMEADVSGGRYAVRFGNQKINLHVGKAEFLPAARNPAFGSGDICFVVECGLREVKTELEAKGVDIEEGIVSRHGALGEMKSIYVRDPDGNLIELAEY